MTHSPPRGGSELTRRKFISGFVSLTAVAAASAAGLIEVPARGLSTPAASQEPAGSWLPLAGLADLTPGVPQAFPFARRLQDGWVQSLQTGIAYAITHDGRDVRVFANVCTHGDCRVTWQPAEQAFVCPCHAGRFAVDGSVLAGPPPRPLEQLTSRVRQGQLEILIDL